MGKVKRWVLLVALGLILGLTVYRWNAQSLAGDRMPMPFGVGAAVVLSGSMEPALSVDDLVVVKAADQVQVGDVVVFQSEGSLVIHRVISLDGDTLTTQGDANNTPDDPISLECVKGVLLFAVPKVGVAVDFLRQPWVIIAVLVAAFLLLELSYRKEKEKDDTELEDLKAEIISLARELREEQEN